MLPPSEANTAAGRGPWHQVGEKGWGRVGLESKASTGTFQEAGGPGVTQGLGKIRQVR
jgi:hypothetical protein